MSSDNGSADIPTWTKRIGPDAAVSLRRALRYKRIGGSCTLLFVVFEIGFQVANIRAGIILSVLWAVASIYFFARNTQTLSITRRLAAEFLGAPEAAKYIPLVYTEVFDKWIAARNLPGWPRKARGR